YLRQGASAMLELKHKIRRGQGLSLNFTLKLDRYAEGAAVWGKWTASPLSFDDVPVLNDWSRDGGQEQQLAQTCGYGTGIDGGSMKLAGVANGKHLAKTTVHLKLSMKEPFIGPIIIDLPVSTPVEL